LTCDNTGPSGGELFGSIFDVIVRGSLVGSFGGTSLDLGGLKDLAKAFSSMRCLAEEASFDSTDTTSLNVLVESGSIAWAGDVSVRFLYSGWEWV